MAGAFESSASVDIGANRTPASGTDTIEIWVGGSIGAGVTTHSGQTLGGTSMTEPANQDQGLDVAGNGDPCGFLAHLVNPGTSSVATAVTYSASRAQDNGRCLTLSGIDQTTPVYPTNGSQGSTYTGTASPSIGYDAPEDSVVVYWRIHAQGGSAITWTPPSGFTLAGTTDIITSPARRQIAIWYKEVSSAEVAATVSATSGASGDGIHGVVTFQGAATGGTQTDKTVSSTTAKTLTTLQELSFNKTLSASSSKTLTTDKLINFNRTKSSSTVKTLTIDRLVSLNRTKGSSTSKSMTLGIEISYVRTLSYSTSKSLGFSKGILLSVLSVMSTTKALTTTTDSILGKLFSYIATKTTSLQKNIGKLLTASTSKTMDTTKSINKTLSSATSKTFSTQPGLSFSMTLEYTTTKSVVATQVYQAAGGIIPIVSTATMHIGIDTGGNLINAPTFLGTGEMFYKYDGTYYRADFTNL